MTWIAYIRIGRRVEAMRVPHHVWTHSGFPVLACLPVPRVRVVPGK